MPPRKQIYKITYVRLPHAPHRKVFACSTACRVKRYQHTVERSVTTCERCGQSFAARRGAHYCSPACRQSAYRNGPGKAMAEAIAHASSRR